MPRLDGVDTSAAQTISDPAAIPALRFWSIQVSASWEGKRPAGVIVPNSKLDAQRAAAKAKGIPIVWYMVPVGPNGGTLEAQWARFLAHVGSVGPGEGVMLDVEFGVGYEWMRAWTDPQLNGLLERIMAYLGRPCFLYGDEAFMRQAPARCVRWAAHYGRNPGDESERAVMLKRYDGIDVDLWQWAGTTGRVAGFSGPVDSNEIIDEARFREAMGMAAGPILNPAASPSLLSTWDIKNGTKRRTIRPRVIVLHANAAGSAVSLASNKAHAEAGGAQAHFQIQGGFHSDGTVGAFQFLPTDREGVGSWNGDPFAITIETQDNGAIPIEKLRATPWTPAQVEAIAQVCAVECRRWGIPARLCDRWDGSGIGYHRQWGINTVNAPSKGWGVPVGTQKGYVNPWTMAAGKTCPEDARIAQVPTVIARVAQLLAAPPQEDEDMTPEQDKMLKDLLAKVSALEPKVNALYGNFDPTSTSPPQNIGYWILWSLLYGTDEQRPATKADLAAAAQALRDALANLPPVPVEVPELTMTLSGTAKAAEPS